MSYAALQQVLYPVVLIALDAPKDCEPDLFQQPCPSLTLQWDGAFFDTDQPAALQLANHFNSLIPSDAASATPIRIPETFPTDDVCCIASEDDNLGSLLGFSALRALAPPAFLTQGVQAHNVAGNSWTWNQEWVANMVFKANNVCNAFVWNRIREVVVPETFFLESKRRLAAATRRSRTFCFRSGASSTATRYPDYLHSSLKIDTCSSNRAATCAP